MKNTMKNLMTLAVAAMTASSLMLAGCGSESETESINTSEASDNDASSAQEAEEVKDNDTEKSQEEDAEETAKADPDAPVIDSLTYESTMELQYAEVFNVYYYNDGYKVLDVEDGAAYLIVPEGKDVPENLEEDMVVLQQPLERVYLAATSAMSLINAAGALSNIMLTGTQKSGWYIDCAVEAMEAGDITYAGKYSEPDYEMLIDTDCDLAIESTMIYHTPKVMEMIEELGIPVFVDRSSYEENPLGRTEWVKAYAALFNQEETAKTFFDEQSAVLDEMENFKNTGKTIAFFYINTDGSVVVRGSKDYIANMCEIAGGKYVFDDLTGDSSNASVNISIEDFYAAAVDADYLIYNGAISDPLKSVDDLIAKNELFKDFKAVQEGNVWTTGKSMYQSTDIIGELIRDVNQMLTTGDDEGMTFLSKVE